MRKDRLCKRPLPHLPSTHPLLSFFFKKINIFFTDIFVKEIKLLFKLKYIKIIRNDEKKNNSKCVR